MEANSKLRRWQLRRVFVVSVAIIAVAWGMLQLMRYRAEHRAIPVFVILQLPPSGPMAASFIAAEMTNIGTPVPYQKVTNPPISTADVAAIRRCLAREQFLSLFPSEIAIRNEEVTARYGMKINRRTGRVRESVVSLAHETNSWRIERVYESTGRACFVRPPTL